jgi:hypothetical protein
MALSHDDITEIQQLEALYGHAVDAPDQSLLPLVFTKDAIFDGRPCGTGSYYEGLDAISAWFGEGKPPHPNVHNMFNVWAYEKDGQVCVKSKWMVRNPRTKEIVMGDYDDLLERTADGWRIKRRTVTARDPSGDFNAIARPREADALV